MSNFDYHIGYLPVSRKQMRTNALKLWAKSFGLAVVTVCLCIFLFKVFISNPIPDIQVRQAVALNSTPNTVVLPNDHKTIVSATIEETDIAPPTETVVLEENLTNIKNNNFEIAAVTNEPSLINALPSINNESTVFESKGTLVETKLLTDTTIPTKNDPIENIMKQIAADKAAVSTQTMSEKFIPIETFKTVSIKSTDEIMLTSPNTKSAINTMEVSASNANVISTDHSNASNTEQSGVSTLFDESELESLFNTSF